MKTTPKCKCGNDLETEDQWLRLCHPCMEAREAQIEAERAAAAEAKRAAAIDHNRKRAAARMDQITPPRMAATSTTDCRFNLELWRKVEPWQPSTEKPWLGLVGEPGACKTRIAFLKSRLLADGMAEGSEKCRSFSIHETCAGDFQQKVRDLTSRDKVMGSTHDFRTVEVAVATVSANWIDALQRADLLIFDELGKVASSPAVASAIFTLIDHRHKNNLLTVWTSNSAPESFCANWPEEFAGPAAGRIIETSTIFTT